MRQLINFFLKKRIFLHDDYCSNFKRRYSTYIFIRLTHHKKRDRNSTFLVKKWKKFVFTKKIMFFLQTSRLKTYQSPLIHPNSRCLGGKNFVNSPSSSIFFWAIIPYDGLMFQVMIDESWRSFSQMWICSGVSENLKSNFIIIGF